MINILNGSITKEEVDAAFAYFAENQDWKARITDEYQNIRLSVNEVYSELTAVKEAFILVCKGQFDEEVFACYVNKYLSDTALKIEALKAMGTYRAHVSDQGDWFATASAVTLVIKQAGLSIASGIMKDAEDKALRNIEYENVLSEVSHMRSFALHFSVITNEINSLASLEAEEAMVEF